MKTLFPDQFELSTYISGMWRLPLNTTESDMTAFVETCIELGVTTFDHADIYGDYGAEAVFGQTLKAHPHLRDQMEIVTKCGIKLLSGKRPDHLVQSYDTSAAHIRLSVENSLSNLHTDHIDLLLIHRPDFLMDADEVAETFEDLRKEGKVKHFGVSNHTVSQFDLLQSRLPFPLATNQLEFSVLHFQPMEDGTLDQAQQLGCPPMIWSPLGGGSLFTAEDERTTRVRNALAEVGNELDTDNLMQVAFAWLRKHPSRPVIVLGTYKPDRIRESVEAEYLNMTRQQWYRIWEANKGHRVP